MAKNIIDVLVAAETNSENAPDMRKVIGDERQGVVAAMGRLADARKKLAASEGKPALKDRLEGLRAEVESLEAHVSGRIAEAKRVAAMWGVAV